MGGLKIVEPIEIKIPKVSEPIKLDIAIHLPEKPFLTRVPEGSDAKGISIPALDPKMTITPHLNLKIFKQKGDLDAVMAKDLSGKTYLAHQMLQTTPSLKTMAAFAVTFGVLGVVMNLGMVSGMLGFMGLPFLGMVMGGGRRSPTGPLTAEVSPPEFKGYYGSTVPESLGRELMDLIPEKEGVTLHQTRAEDLHITIIDPAEINLLVAESQKKDPSLSKSKAQALVKEKIKALPAPQGKPVVTGIGSATDAQKGHTVYFATVEWPEAQALRAQLGLPPKDLHITLASTAEKNGKPEDVHGLSKTEPNVLRFGKVESKPGLRKKFTTVSAGVSAVIAMILGAVTLDNFIRLKHLEEHGETPNLAGNGENLRTISTDENNGVIDMHRIQSQGTVVSPKGQVNIQVETLYLDYNHKAILTVTTPKPISPESIDAGNGEFMTEITISGVNRFEADLLHKQFSKEYQETGSAQAAFEWLRRSPWWSMAGSILKLKN